MSALLAAVLALTGCAAIPTEGPVVQGVTGADNGGGGFGVLPVGPDAGETPEGIVRGFLLAAAGVENDFAVARQFLAAPGATSWQPNTSTVVYGGATPAVTMLDAAGAAVPEGADTPADQLTARIVVPVVATIDTNGGYTPAPEGTEKQVDFAMKKVSGQWRISRLDDQVLIADSDFALVYEGYELYFLDPTLSFLVPETRWFPDRTSTATSLVTQLLRGPSPWLAPGVTTAFPTGTGLDLESVPIEAGVARVDLTAPARQGSSPADRALMQAQLEATLGPVPTVTSVEMRVDGSPIALPQQPAGVLQDVPVDESPVLVADGTLVRLRVGELVGVEGLPPLGDLVISHPGMSLGEVTYAVLAAQRSQLLHLVPGSEQVPEPLVRGADLTAPSFDRLGWIWSTPAVSTGVVTAALPDGTVAQVEAAWLAGRRVTSLRIARDGTRAAVASTDASGRGHVDVASVVRTPLGVPERLEQRGPDTVGSALVAAEEVAWVDEVTIAALGRRAGDEQPRVHLLRLGGPAEPPLATTPDGVTLAAARGPRTIVVGTSEGELLVQAGAVWVPQPGAAGARQPAFAG